MSYDGAVVMHYQFRSTEEFCNKITRRKYFENRKFTNYTYRTTFIKEYFNQNSITKVKIELIEKCLGEKIDDKFKRNIY